MHSTRPIPPPQSSARVLLLAVAVLSLLAGAYIFWTHEPVSRGVYDAVISGDLAAVRRRVAEGGDVNWSPPESGFGPLHEAVFDGRTDIAAFLVAHGADVNAQGVFGDAPLHDVRDAGLARLLLTSGARTDVSSNTLGTPLHAAVMHSEPALVRLLIEHGANVDAIDVNGSTPLHHAAGLGDLASARMLMNQGASVDAVNGPGYTALHWAAGNGGYEMAALLLARGADPGIRAMDGKSAADAARARGHLAVTGLIESVDSRPNDASAPAVHRRFSTDR